MTEQELGSKAALQMSMMGTVSLILTDLLIKPHYYITVAIILEMVIFILFIGKKTDQLNKMAFYDELTNLPNRLFMKNTLEYYLNSTENLKKTCYLYLFLIDLDQFKEVNDTYGHDTGDRLLQCVTARMTKAVPDDVEICRIGGDEFTVLMPFKHGDDEVESIAEKLIHCLEQPIQIDNNTIAVSMSIGISVFPNDGKDAATLFKKADIAMYAAKNEGRNRYTYFNRLAPIEDL
jgi:diguanylate cyclase (GGDEF)-like protein